MEYNKIVLIGAGAVGSYFIWGLGDKLSLCAEGARAERLKKNGVLINHEVYRPEVLTPEEAYGADLVMVAVKDSSLPEAVDMVKRIVDDHTVVMSLMNGVTSEETLGAAVGMEKLVYSLMKIAAEHKDDSVNFIGEITPGVFYGEKDGTISERIEALDALFAPTPIHYHPSTTIIQDLWSKFAHNVANNLPQAIIGCGIGAFDDSEHGRALTEALRNEVIAVALAKGIDIRQTASSVVQRGSASKISRYSTLQDLDMKRHTEVDLFAGAMMRMGQETGIATPFCEFCYHAIRMLEEQNDGMYDYPPDMTT